MKTGWLHKFACVQGALNVAAFEEAYEDRDSVYIITELCRGGELWHRIGDKHYSERTVSTLKTTHATLHKSHVSTIASWQVWTEECTKGTAWSSGFSYV